MKAYFGYFESIGAEGFANKFEQADSIILKVPYAKLTIQLKDGNSITHDYYSYDDIMDKTNKTRRPEDINEISRFFVHGKDDDYFRVQIQFCGNFFLGYRTVLNKNTHSMKTNFSFYCLCCIDKYFPCKVDVWGFMVID